MFLSAVGFFFSLHFTCYSCIVQFLSLCGSCSVSVCSSVSVLFYVVLSISTVVASVLELSFTSCSGGWFFTTQTLVTSYGSSTLCRLPAATCIPCNHNSVSYLQAVFFHPHLEKLSLWQRTTLIWILLEWLFKMGIESLKVFIN
jgi:hypothetical protein